MLDKLSLWFIMATSFNNDGVKSMPNWCNNRVTLKHADPAMLKRAEDAFDRGEFLEEFIPVPYDLKTTMQGFLGDPEQQNELLAKQAANVEKHGYPNWYEFCNAEWGTKWDVGGVDNQCELEGDTLSLSFDSAWSPPIEAYEKLTEMGFDIEAYYYEGGCAFCGSFIGNEEDTDHEEYGIDGDSVWVAENIPTAIDEAFAISENMAIWEDEEDYEEEDDE